MYWLDSYKIYQTNAIAKSCKYYDIQMDINCINFMAICKHKILSVYHQENNRVGLGGHDRTMANKYF